jgi:hypothetical protein
MAKTFPHTAPVSITCAVLAITYFVFCDSITLFEKYVMAKTAPVTITGAVLAITGAVLVSQRRTAL